MNAATTATVMYKSSQYESHGFNGRDRHDGLNGHDGYNSQDSFKGHDGHNVLGGHNGHDCKVQRPR